MKMEMHNHVLIHSNTNTHIHMNMIKNLNIIHNHCIIIHIIMNADIHINRDRIELNPLFRHIRSLREQQPPLSQRFFWRLKLVTPPFLERTAGAARWRAAALLRCSRSRLSRSGPSPGGAIVGGGCANDMVGTVRMRPAAHRHWPRAAARPPRAGGDAARGK